MSEPVTLEIRPTPGPWTAECVVGDYPHDICGPDRPGEGSPNLLASVAYDDDDPLPHLSLAEANANARLIAAAPDLLALARRCAHECAECNGSAEIVCNDRGGDPADDYSKPCPECADIWAVINKAEGRT